MFKYMFVYGIIQVGIEDWGGGYASIVMSDEKTKQFNEPLCRPSRVSLNINVNTFFPEPLG